MLVDHGNPIIGPFLMAVIAIICLTLFVYFIHHSVRWIQVNNLIAKIRMDGSKVTPKRYEDYLYKSFYQIRHYGKEDVINWDKLSDLDKAHLQEIYCLLQGLIRSEGGSLVMQGMKRLGISIIIILCIILTACSSSTSTVEKEKDTTGERDESNEPEVIEKEITLTAVGDILIHDRVYDDAETSDGYDFMPMLEKVEPFLNDTTITFANQETMIGGESIGLSGYPSFNSPTEIGDALKQVGVDVVSIANNHTLDRGEKAIQNAIKHWEKIDMMYTGAYKDEADRDHIRIYETDENISVAFLAYTYGTNGIPVPDGKDYLVNFIDKDVLASDIAEAKEKADVTVLSLHFGEEYERMPNQEQKDLVQFAADQGVEVVLGHHPHVLQPVEWVEGEDGNETFVIYSLGNFLSGQYEHHRRIGGIAKITIKQTIMEGEETIEVVDPQFMPTYVNDNDENNYKVIPMYQLTDDILKDAEKHYEKTKDHMSQWMPELEFMEE